MNMKKNVGTTDRIVRIVVGIGLIGATLMGALPVWGWIGIIPLATGIASWCPVYTLLGIKTCCCCCGGKCEPSKKAPEKN